MPEQSGKIVFDESLGSLMAHTVRAITNRFLQRGIELDVRIVADTANAITRLDRRMGTLSLLRTRWQKILNGTHDRLFARIYIHQHANRCLARICIAHEIYHLILEFNAFVANDRREWNRIEVNDEIEKQCNEFAWSLLDFHDKFNKSEDLRKDYMYFPDGVFKEPLDIHNPDKWPKGICLDPEHPFHKPPKH